MQVVGLIPYWIDYYPDNEQHKNLKKLGGRYLINYSLKLLSSVDPIAMTYVYASNEGVLDYIDDDDSLVFEFLERPSFLDDNDVSIEDIIDEFLKTIEADVIVLLHPNSPFLQRSTVNECVEKVVSGEVDSAFTAYKYQKLSWFEGKPLNYALDRPTPKLSEVAPVFFEQSSLYVFSRKLYDDTRKRVGKAPYIKCINHFEGHDINVEEDFEIAELIVNSGMYSEL